MRAAFYTATQPGIAGIYNRLVRWWERGRYSHCELIFGDVMAASSSFLDGGVRFKQITFDPGHWDFIDLPDHLEAAARAWFVANDGKPYDLMGNLHFIVGAVGPDRRKWFCSESLAAALGILEPWRFEPNVLHAVLSHRWPALSS